jgi:malate synthase
MVSASTKNIYSLVDIKVNVPFGYKQLLSCKALKFLADLHLNFNDRRLDLLSMREERRIRTSKDLTNAAVQNSDAGNINSFETVVNLNGFKNRQLEILGANELISKKNLFQSDDKLHLIHFESSNTAMWTNLVEAQITLKDAINSKMNSALSEDDQSVCIAAKEILVMVCPRNLSKDEKNIYIDSNPLCAALFDLGLFLFHNAKILSENGSNAYLYLNNIENYYEAKYWNEIIAYTEEELSLPEGKIKTLLSFDKWLASFEIDHINEELKDHLLN